MFLFLKAKQTRFMSNVYFPINKSPCMRMNTYMARFSQFPCDDDDDGVCLQGYDNIL